MDMDVDKYCYNRLFHFLDFVLRQRADATHFLNIFILRVTQADVQQGQGHNYSLTCHNMVTNMYLDVTFFQQKCHTQIP